MTEKCWFESWFDSPYYHILYQNRDFTEARQFIDALLRFLGPAVDCKFLDLACGKGRHSIYLNSKGYDVTGIDLSENSIRQARAFENDHLHFAVWDMRKTYRKEGFHFVLNLFTSFGYFETRAEHLDALRAVCENLKEEGVFVLDFLNAEFVSKNTLGRETVERNGIVFHTNKKMEDNKIIKDISFKSEDGDSFYTEEVWAFTKKDLEEMLETACFEIMHRFGDYALRPFDAATSPRLIIIAKKKH